MPLYGPAPARNESDGASLSVPWRLLTLGLAVVTVASLGALVTVASINDADELSTVALALAVLAFAAQLVISLAQGQAATRQEAENRRIASDTQAALAEIRASTAGLMNTVGTQYDRVLDAVLQTVPTAVAQQDGLVIDPAALRAQIEQELRREQPVTLAGLAGLDDRPQTDFWSHRRARAAEFRIGEEVVHDKWGIGRVVEVNPERAEGTIDFPDVGLKHLDLVIAPLVRLAQAQAEGSSESVAPP